MSMTKPPLKTLAAALLLGLSAGASSQSGWRDMNGVALPESDNAKTRQGFSASLIITPDKDWQEKWNTPPETVPSFRTASEVSDGGELFILTFLSNPQLDATGMTDVSCDFRVQRPDGSLSADEHGLPCFRVQLKTDPRHVYLSTASMVFVAEPSDVRGTWRVEVTVTDRQRQVSIPLQSSFTLK
ncbi:hypothetical protein ACS5PK_11255 [Roseateles sp. DB2]|uniref:hypothetical protein n=1 Tax=Roseateles sp. DB2 TaxID=3453717 RepID=UPI003EEC168B